VLELSDARQRRKMLLEARHPKVGQSKAYLARLAAFAASEAAMTVDGVRKQAAHSNRKPKEAVK
jgi:hypothetical protein